MRKVFLLSAALIMLLAFEAGAADLAGSCRIQFYGDSTLHGFSGTAACEPFALRPIAPAADSFQLAGTEIQVAVAGMDTDNDSRDNKMYDMFGAADHPFIIGRIRDFDASDLLTQLEKGGRLSFDLVIRDRAQAVQANVTDLTREPGRVTFSASFPVSLKAYDLKAPGVLGIIRVADEVRVVVAVVLEGDVLSSY